MITEKWRTSDSEYGVVEERNGGVSCLNGVNLIVGNYIPAREWYWWIT